MCMRTKVVYLNGDFMTVRELIEELQRLPDDLPVMVGCSEAEKVYLNKEHYFGDSANPDCRVGSAVEIV